MKATTANRNDFMRTPVYPNAASRSQSFRKVLDFLLLAAAGGGIGAILIFILAIT